MLKLLDWSSNKNQMGFSEYNSHTFNSYAIADSIKQLLLVPNSNSQQINMAACTTTLSFAENKRGNIMITMYVYMINISFVCSWTLSSGEVTFAADGCNIPEP